MREMRKWCPTMRPVKLLGDKHERARCIREDLRDPESFDVCVTMRPYQIEGLNWLVKLHDNGINGILADEMVRSRRPFHFVVAAATACR